MLAKVMKMTYYSSFKRYSNRLTNLQTTNSNSRHYLEYPTVTRTLLFKLNTYGGKSVRQRHMIHHSLLPKRKKAHSDKSSMFFK